jgi:NADH-quinone oxidoreductase subunit E
VDSIESEESVDFQLVVEPDPEPIVPPPAAAPPSPVEEPAHDEDAAMRAIEGGWSRVKARALHGEPELSDAGAAVAAAQTAVEQVLAQAGIDVETSQRASRPKGLTGPRAGRRDDLKRIDGVGALDESTLNNLGVYHFDQIAGWDDAQVLWMENHVFARGRITREEWQRQARDLADG